MPHRRQARTIAFQILYSIVYSRLDVDEAARRYSMLEPERRRPLPPYALNLARVVLHNQDALDERVNAHLEHWRPERLLLPDRLLLRMACAEFYHFNDIPPKVTLDEYIELARKFGDDASPAFVNGVLDAVLKSAPLPEGKAEGPPKRPPRKKKLPADAETPPAGESEKRSDDGADPT